MPVTVEIPKEKWTGSIREVTIGATADDGGTRTKTVTVGGQTTLPFLHFEGDTPNPPVIGIEIRDGYPADWSPALLEALCGLFHQQHRSQFGHSAENEPVEFVCFRVVGILPVKELVFPDHREVAGPELKGRRNVYFGPRHGFEMCPIYDRSRMYSIYSTFQKKYPGFAREVREDPLLNDLVGHRISEIIAGVIIGAGAGMVMSLL